MGRDTQGTFLDRIATHLPASDGLAGADYRALLDQIPQMIWSTLPDGYHDYYNLRWYEFTGAPVGSTDGEKWNGMFHAEDQQKSWEIWRHSLQTGEPYEVEYRLRHHSGQYRWTLGRAMPIRDGEGRIVRWIGTCTDIHEQKQLAEINSLLVGELSHRIRNIFAVVNALVSLSAAGRPDQADFATILKDRIIALGNAHEFVRPHSETSRPFDEHPALFGMLDRIFAAIPAYREGRIAIHGDDIRVDDQAATPLSLIFHELMTNALKYGALSDDGGNVELRSAKHNDVLKIEWREYSPHLTVHQPDHAGFGTQLIDMSVEAQLGGQVTRIWHLTGLQMNITVPILSIYR